MSIQLILLILIGLILWPRSYLFEVSNSIDLSSSSYNECRVFYDSLPKSVDERFFRFPGVEKPSYLINADFFSGLKERKSKWVTHRDDLGNRWITGFSNMSVGVSEFVLRSPTELQFQEQLLTVIDYFKTFGFSQIPESKMGLVLQLESGSAPYARGPSRNFHLYQMKELERLKKNGQLPTAQVNAFEDYLDFLMDGYGRRMKVSEENKAKLKTISLELKERSHLLFLSQEGMVDYRDSFGLGILRNDARVFKYYEKNPEATPTRVLPSKFNFIGGAIFVTSNSAKELLPLEIFTGFRVPRKTGVTAEIGRFYVDRLHRDPNTSYALIGLVGSLLASAKDKNIGMVDQIVIEADKARAEIFAEYGFRPIHKQTNFQGKEEFIMTASPETVMNMSKAKLIKDLNPNRKHTATVLYRPKQLEIYVSKSSLWDQSNFRGPFHTFGGGSSGQLLNDFYDLSLSTMDIASKIKVARKIIESDFADFLPAFDSDPQSVTQKLLGGAAVSADAFIKVVRVAQKPFMTQKEYDSKYLTDGINKLFEKLESQLSLYPSKFEKLRVIKEYLDSSMYIWHVLNGDHGKFYLLLDYYLNGSPTYTPRMAFSKAVSRNSNNDLNYFEFNFPEIPKALEDLAKKALRDNIAVSKLPELRVEVYRLYKSDPKFRETDFETVWRVFDRVIRSSEHQHTPIDIVITHHVWANLIIMSKYIEDITFTLRNESDE